MCNAPTFLFSRIGSNFPRRAPFVDNIWRCPQRAGCQFRTTPRANEIYRNTAVFVACSFHACHPSCTLFLGTSGRVQKQTGGFFSGVIIPSEMLSELMIWAYLWLAHQFWEIHIQRSIRVWWMCENTAPYWSHISLVRFTPTLKYYASKPFVNTVKKLLLPYILKIFQLIITY